MQISEKSYKIIVADDDADDQYLIKQAFRETLKSYNVQAVSNGMELLELLFETGKGRVEKPDCIILDLNMPLVDGFQVLEKLRKEKSTSDIPVFILSTSRFERDRIKSEEMGANGFYSKPYQFDELKRIIRNICAETRMQA